MMQKKLGFSFTEIMVSLFLTSLIIIALAQHYLLSKRQYEHSQALLEHAFDLQLVTDLIQDSVRRAGFTPCLNLNYLKIKDWYTNKSIVHAIELDKQRLHIHRMSENFSVITEILSPTRLLAIAIKSYDIERPIFLTDCHHGEIQRVLSFEHTNKGNVIRLEKPLAFDYETPLYLGEWLEEQFYIQKNTQGEPALFYKIGHAEELTSKVKTFAVTQVNDLIQIALGLDNGQKFQIETAVRSK